MSARVVFQHELDDDMWVVITAKGELGLDTLQSIEEFCHRQRFHLCQKMKAALDTPTRVSTSEKQR